MLRPHQSADSDHRSATASAGRCCLGSAVSPRVRDSFSHSDPCLHLTNGPNGLSTLRRVLRRICRGPQEQSDATDCSEQKQTKQQRKYMDNQQLVFQVKSTKPTHEHSSHNPHASVRATWLLVHAAWCCEGMKTKASTELLDNCQRRFSSTLPAVLKTRLMLALSVTTSALWSALQ